MTEAAPAQSSRIKPFHAYLGATGTWFAAVGIQMVLFPYLVTVVLHESPAMVGIAQMSLMAPSLFLLLPGGALADSADSRDLVVRFSLIATLPPLVLAFTLWLGGLSYTLLVCYALFMGSLSALALPARDSMLTQVSPPGGLQNAVSLVVAAQFGTQMFGMALAGGAAVVGPEPLLILQGAIFVVSLLLARQLPAHPPHPDANSGLKARVHAVEEGFVAAVRSPVIFPVIIAMTGVGLFYVGSFMSIVPIIIRDGYQGDASIFSLVNVCFWGGTIIATFGLMRVGAIHRRGRLLTLALCTGLTVLALMSIAWPLWAFCLLCMLWGMGAGVTITMGRTIVQEAAPQRMRARVLAFYQLGFSGGGPIGALALGFIVQALGPFQAVYVPSIAMALVLILLVTATRLWHISPKSH